MVNSQPPLGENQYPIEGRTVEYAQYFKRACNMNKMNKKELKRVKNAAFNHLKDRSSTAVKLEYHLENIARAMSTDFDWLTLNQM